MFERKNLQHRIQASLPLEIDVKLWVLAVLLFGVGDLVTTIYFIHIGVAVEANPLAAEILTFGYEWLVIWKAIVIGAFYAFYRGAPRTIRVGVPLGLVLIGGLITVWNTFSSVTRTPLFF